MRLVQERTRLKYPAMISPPEPFYVSRVNPAGAKVAAERGAR